MHQISEFFYDSWDQLDHKKAIQMMLIKSKVDSMLEAEQYEWVGRMGFFQLQTISRDPLFLKKLTEEQIYDIRKDLVFIDSPWLFFHIVAIKGKHHTYFSPGERMYDLTFQHLIYADANFSKYLITEQPRDLDKFIASLYQPMFEGDRIPFIPDNLDPIGEDIGAALHRHEKQLILTTYVHIRNSIMERCPALFKSSSEPDNNSSSVEYTGEMWRDLLYELADTPAFQGIEAAKSTPIYEALDYLEKKAKELLTMKKPKS